MANSGAGGNGDGGKWSSQKVIIEYDFLGGEFYSSFSNGLVLSMDVLL
jgi:hypothetical protein